MIIHYLKYGLPVCGFSQEVPAKWPPEHAWIPAWDVTGFGAKVDATCKTCLIIHEEFNRGYKSGFYEGWQQCLYDHGLSNLK